VARSFWHAARNAGTCIPTTPYFGGSRLSSIARKPPSIALLCMSLNLSKNPAPWRPSLQTARQADPVEPACPPPHASGAAIHHVSPFGPMTPAVRCPHGLFSGADSDVAPAFIAAAYVLSASGTHK
jgi:hypothetical protein